MTDIKIQCECEVCEHRCVHIVGREELLVRLLGVSGSTSINPEMMEAIEQKLEEVRRIILRLDPVLQLYDPAIDEGVPLDRKFKRL